MFAQGCLYCMNEGLSGVKTRTGAFWYTGRTSKLNQTQIYCAGVIFYLFISGHFDDCF